jgi:peptidoglycan/LPS O-acetylase OafA/YrhL
LQPSSNGALPARRKLRGPAPLRPEIQALRAIAVTTVVVFHLWPLRLTGGYVGVDVFFAISGYLITGHILKEMSHERGFSLPSFWARRIRRLLPAATLVLIVTLIATVIFTQAPVWAALSPQVIASAGGFENWLLAINAVDYFGANNAPTAVQHYWSLSAEEQFYVVWAIALFAIAALTRKSSAPIRRRVVIVAIGVLIAASLSWSIIQSFTNQQIGYFSTLTHAWEFGLGGLMAAVLSRGIVATSTRLAWLRPAVTSMGIAAILASSVVLTGATRFPGWVAIIPVGGAVLVMIFGGRSDGRIRTPFIWMRPIEFIGAVSFAMYLWHWPLIVLGPSVLGRPLNTCDKFVILFASIALAWLTKITVEDPLRRSKILGTKSWRTFAMGAIATALTIALALGAGTWANSINAEIAAENAKKVARALVKPSTSCLGAFAMSHPADCPDIFTVSAKYGPDVAKDDWGPIAGVNKDGTMPTSTCTKFGPDNAYSDCLLVDSGASAPGMVIVGDSHALALLEPIAVVARAQKITLHAILKNSCTPTQPQQYDNQANRAACNDWRYAMMTYVAEMPHVSTVIAAGYTRKEGWKDSAQSKSSIMRDYTGLWSQWVDAGKKILVVEDVPMTSGQSVPECVKDHPGVVDPCSVTRAKSLTPDIVVDAVAYADDPNIQLMSLNDAFCDKTTCHAVIGATIAYRDSHHLSATFALTLVPHFEAAFTNIANSANLAR